MKNHKKNKTIHVVSQYFYPVIGGMEINMLETYSTFVKRGWEVVIHTSKNTLSEKNILSDYESIRGIKIKRYTSYLLNFFPKLNWKSADIIVLHNFNVIPHLYILFYSFLLKILGKKNFILILSPHGGFNPQWSIFPQLQALIKKTYHYTLGVFLINNIVDGIRTVSEWERIEMIKMGVNNSLIKVINNGLHNEAFKNVDRLASKKIKLLSQEMNPYIIQLGRIHPIKNYETTIKAMQKLPLNLKYLIVGPTQDKEYKNNLLNLIDKLNLKNRVIFFGEVTDFEKYYLMKNAELMVHMALHEGYCNAVHEGMSQGLVCIVSNQTALPFLIKNGVNGYCLDPNDYQGVTDKIKFILDNKDSLFIKNMQKRNIKFTKNHSWENVAYQVESFYVSRLDSYENN